MQTNTVCMFTLLTLQFLLRCREIRDSVVGTATNYWLDERGVGVRVPVESRIFSSSSRPTLGPPNLLSNGYRGKAVLP
jgi:hypothetical protein